MTGDVEHRELTPDQARELTNRIRDRLDGFVADLLTAWNGRADKVLGYTNWNAYVVSEFGQAMLRWRDRDMRRRLGARLREIGMPTRAIGSALGVHHRTVERDLVTTGASAPDGRVLSLDGRSRPASRSSNRSVFDAARWDAPNAQVLIETARRDLTRVRERSPTAATTPTLGSWILPTWMPSSWMQSPAQAGDHHPRPGGSRPARVGRCTVTAPTTVTVDRLAQCPQRRSECFAVMFSPWAGLRLARHGDQRHPCYGPSSGELFAVSVKR